MQPNLADRAASRIKKLSQSLKLEFNKRVSGPVFANNLSPAINLRYQRHHTRCGKAFRDAGGVAPSGASEVDRNGYEIVTGILPPATANDFSAKLTAANESNAAGIYRAPTWGGKHVSFNRPLDILGDGFFEIIAPAVEAGLGRYYASHYRVQVVHAIRIYPIPQAQGSFLWHTDDMPREAVSLFVYLTDTDAHGGSTAFLNREETRALRRKGYTGQVTRKRIDDIAEYASTLGVSCRPFRPELSRGDGIIWQNNVLHRGILPTRGYRDLLSIMFLPSPRPWRDELRREGFDALQERAAGGESGSRWKQWIGQLEARD